MDPLTPPIYGLSPGRLVVFCDSRLPLLGSVELQAGVLIIVPVVVLHEVVPRRFQQKYVFILI